MTDWLLAQSLPLSLVLAGLLLAHSRLLGLIGARALYGLWSLAPLLLSLSLLPLESTGSLPLQQYLVVAQGAMTTRAAAAGDWLHLAWLAGALLLGNYWLLSHWHFRQQLAATPCRQRLADLPSGLRLKESRALAGPVLSGLFRPTLVLPADFQSRYSRAQQALVIRHELCHFRRGDLYWNLLALAVLLLFWFNPLCWLAYRRYRRDQELACDEAVLAQEGKEGRLDYGRALITSLEDARAPALAHLHYASKETMMERLKQLKNNNNQAKWKGLAALALGLTLVSGLSQAAMSKADGIQAAPKPQYRIEPKYPVAAAKAGTEGSVVLAIDIQPDGKVTNAKVLKSVPAGTFDQAALAAVKKWQYQPSAKGQKGVQLQLDFAMGPDSQHENLVGKDKERIRVKK
ncbi:M56 family metallopeptidase [Gallaecimonas sp. GXIMD4217]|uniref:M56 family metallopeptidase n=1 Tax=Gallaecimonas sp. GXIMD4217 TaxID=3131927 RepID=UPI00311AC500